MILSTTTWTWRPRAMTAFVSLLGLERVAAALSIALLALIWLASVMGPNDESREAGAEGARAVSQSGAWSGGESEMVASGYVGAPFYYPADLKLERPNGTDMVLKNLNWDGDALYFPIDGGARITRWSGMFGTMIDFVHNKAVAEVGKGAHGRKIRNPIVQDVETTGTLKGQPAPSPLHLTDLVERLEFTHGHNVLLLTGLARLAPLTPKVRPYVGLGFGIALPHVEVTFTGEDDRTNEYQWTGPALQLVAGLELRSGRGSYFIEYKFIWASIEAALTGGKSWSFKDLKLEWLPRWLIEPFVGLTEMPGDLFNQFSRWRSGEAPKDGRIATRLFAHQIVGGAGYVWPRAAVAAGEPRVP